MGTKGKIGRHLTATARKWRRFGRLRLVDEYGNGQASRSAPSDGESSGDAIDLIDCPDHDLWGRIPDCLAPYPSEENVAAGAIVVPVGNRSHGYAHIQEKHARKIAALHGGMSVDDYLCDVLRHYQEIYRQADGSLVLLRINGMRKCAVVAPILIGGKVFYKLITAYPLPRKPDFSKRRAARLIYK